MDQEIGEDEDIPRLGMDRGGCRQWPLGLVYIVVSRAGGHILLRTLVVAAGEDSQAPIAGLRVVQVDEDGHHGVVAVGEIVVVLVGGEGGSLPGGLEVGLGVV